MATAGYSGTPLVRKIGIKTGHRVALLHRPPDWELAEVPGRRWSAGGSGVDVTLVFSRVYVDLVAEATTWSPTWPDTAMLWVVAAPGRRPHQRHHRERLRDLFLPLGWST